jgi:hypothetical protein
VADLITTMPWDAIAVSATHFDPDSIEGRYLGLLALLKLGRLYRLVLLFRQMTYDLEHSLLVTTFLRNGAVRHRGWRRGVINPEVLFVRASGPTAQRQGGSSWQCILRPGAMVPWTAPG